MSKILKIIDALILAMFIAAGAALIIPQQFMGIDTMVAEQETTGNVPVGTVVYSKKVSTSEIAEGEKILALDQGAMNVYTVVAYDEKTETVTVDGEGNSSFGISDKYLRVIRTVPLIGYLMIATQSDDGLLLLGVLLLFIIIVFVVSELIRKGSDGEDEDEDEDNVYRDLLEKKKKRAKEAAKAEKARRREERRHHGEAEEEEDADEPLEKIGGDDEGMREIAGGEDEEETGEETEEEIEASGEQEALPDVQAALEAALENQQLNRPGETASMAVPVQEEDVAPQFNENGEIELAMPVYTADELIERAYAKGLDPTVEDDSITGIKIVDFSDCL
jgi:hypothetical protein